MNRSKGIQLGAILAAMLLVSVAFAPAVSAQVENSSAVPRQCNTCGGACNGTQIPTPKVDSNILQGKDKAKFLENTLKSDQFKEIKSEFISRGYSPDIKEAKVISLKNLDTGESGVRVDMPFQTGNESILAVISTYSDNQKQETIGYVQNGNKVEILPHPGANKEISSQAIWIPGYNYIGTFSPTDACWIAEGECVGIFLLSLADIVSGDEAFVATGCGVIGVGCWIIDTINNYSSCGNPEVVLYERAWWNPFGPNIIGYPTC